MKSIGLFKQPSDGGYRALSPLNKSLRLVKWSGHGGIVIVGPLSWGKDPVNGNDSYSIPGFAEPANCFTHMAGAGVFAVLTVFLLRRGWGSRGRVVFLSVFAFSCIFVLSMSGVYHLLPFGSTAREVLRRLDLAAIFTLIAGTFTAAHGILFTGRGRWIPLLLVWSAAITGIVLAAIFAGATPPWLVITIYLAFGWAGAFSAIALWRRYGLSFIQPLMIGAVAYTVGAVVDGAGWPTLIPRVVGPHELFHVAVLIGVAAHWRFVLQFAAGKESEAFSDS